jgi:putative transposase
LICRLLVRGDTNQGEGDSLAVPLYTRAVALQKLTYIHNNPVAGHWQLAADFTQYRYSSAKYYECNEKNFDFLKDLAAEF